MKRSEINKALKEMEAMIRSCRFELLPFCGFTPEEWQEKGHEYDEVRDNMLIVEGEKKNETEDKDEKKGYYRMERSYGSFRRVLSLPEDVETDKITATHKDGVLSIEIPRKEPEKPAARKIEVVKGE